MSILFQFNVITQPPPRVAHGNGGDFPFVVYEPDLFEVDITVFDDTTQVVGPGNPNPIQILVPIIVNSVTMNLHLTDVEITLYNTNTFKVKGNATGTFTDKFYEFRLNQSDNNIITRVFNPYMVQNYYGLTRYKPDPNQFKYLTFLINSTIPCVLEVENNWDIERLIMIDFVNSNRGELDASNN